MLDKDPSDADPFGAIADEFVEAFRQAQRPTLRRDKCNHENRKGRKHERRKTRK